MASTATNNPTAATAPDQEANATADTPGEATILVSEFPPPPFYYHRASSGLAPPPIPTDALDRGTRRAAAAAARMRAQEEAGIVEDKTQAILGGTEDEEETGPVVAVFGEIVEDPMKIQPVDHCENPLTIKQEVKRLNEEVVLNFVQLVNDLVTQPEQNKKTRDTLSRNVLKLLKESNKFREHQAREVFIELVEKQLQHRRDLLAEVNQRIAEADKLLSSNP